jgi:DNA-binding CsgD family transcriptional regulator
MKKKLDLQLREEVLELLQKYQNEISNLNIDHIGYREFHKDGTSMAFCSKKEWYDIAPYSEEIINDMSIHYALELISLNKKGYNFIIRSISLANNRFLKELLRQDMCNSLLIYKRDKDIIKQYSFITSSSNVSILNHFFNKKDNFEKIIELYKHELSNIFQQNKYQELNLQLFNEKTANTIFEGVKTNSNNSILTPKEQECVSLLIRGANNKDIANCLKISPRTASYHVANIKSKLNVNSRYNIKELIKQKL